MFEKIKSLFNKESTDEEKLRKELALKQKEIDAKYKAEGLTDEVLDAQVELNQLRNKYDIEDEKNRIYENFVQ